MLSLARCAGIVLAYSNSVAGRLSDLTVTRGVGNIGCFYGGAAAAGAAVVLLLLFSTFGDLGKQELATQKARS